MLTIEQYGVQLTRLQLDEIELVRNWRNQDFVAQNMDYQKHITQKEQKKWFPGKVNRDPELLPLSSELLQILDIFDAAKRNEALKKCEDCK
jgi:hypothetical protein